MTERPPLDGVLETVLYYGTGQHEDVERFYEDVLGMRPIGKQPGKSLFYRAGANVYLLFNRDTASTQDHPPPHGTTGVTHTCLLATKEEYEHWKDYLRERDVDWFSEIEWRHGGHSFYFNDPAGNLLEIADSDFWPA